MGDSSRVEIVRRTERMFRVGLDPFTEAEECNSGGVFVLECGDKMIDKLHQGSSRFMFSQVVQIGLRARSICCGGGVPDMVESLEGG